MSSSAHELQEADDSSRKFLVFSLSDELYGIPILDVQEVLLPMEWRPVPNTAHFFLGMLNLRGQIVGVLSLRRFFEMEDGSRNDMLVVFPTTKGPFAACVDRIESVATLKLGEIEHGVAVSSRIPAQHISGVTLHNEKMLVILDLKSLVDANVSEAL